MNFELVRLCHNAAVGIIQMPCPEIAVLGLKRQRRPGQSIRDALDTETGRGQCAVLAETMADRLTAYLDEGYELVAILGGNPRSPGCAVLQGENGLHDDSGVFIKQLHREMSQRKRHVVFGALRDHDPELIRQDLHWFAELVQQTGTADDRRGPAPVSASS